MSMRCASYVMATVFAVTAWTGCHAADPVAMDFLAAPDGSSQEAGEGDEQSSEAKREGLEVDLAIARIKLEHANMELQMNEVDSTASIGFAKAELDLSRARMAQFSSLDMPNRIARNEISLQRAKDSTAEAEEELAQIQMMYKEQDLEEMTAEFVINRGERNLRRARKSLDVQEREFEALTEHELPRELESLALDVERKTSALLKAETGAAASLLMKKVAVMTADESVKDLEEELEELAEEQEG